MPRDDLRRLTSPQGSTVIVAADFAEQLIASAGYTPIEDEPKRGRSTKTEQDK